mmetsp:Transcript_22314/g.53369  ORF Transcript_22314/g.53369 Transcript_22314/m.53369 type:complete len:268 (+) Transcript_22314:1393-2196(+)
MAAWTPSCPSRWRPTASQARSQRWRRSWTPCSSPLSRPLGCRRRPTRRSPGASPLPAPTFRASWTTARPGRTPSRRLRGPTGSPSRPVGVSTTNRFSWSPTTRSGPRAPCACRRGSPSGTPRARACTTRGTSGICRAPCGTHCAEAGRPSALTATASGPSAESLLWMGPACRSSSRRRLGSGSSPRWCRRSPRMTSGNICPRAAQTGRRRWLSASTCLPTRCSHQTRQRGRRWPRDGMRPSRSTTGSWSRSSPARNSERGRRTWDRS